MEEASSPVTLFTMPNDRSPTNQSKYPGFRQRRSDTRQSIIRNDSITRKERRQHRNLGFDSTEMEEEYIRSLASDVRKAKYFLCVFSIYIIVATIRETIKYGSGRYLSYQMEHLHLQLRWLPRISCGIYSLLQAVQTVQKNCTDFVIFLSFYLPVERL